MHRMRFNSFTTRSHRTPTTSFGFACKFCLPLACIALAVTGCGGGEKRVQTFKSAGRVVKSDGTPVPHALVVFHPANGVSDAPKPRGTTDDSGQFQLSTYDTNDGAPVGAFVVTIEQWIRDDPNLPAKNHLPEVLGKAASSGLQVTIASGENQLTPFEIR